MDNTKGIGSRPNDTPSVKKGKNYFLGIGINEYTSGWSALNNAVRDVERVGHILKEKYDFDILHILTNAQATRSDILKQLRALQALSKDDSLLYSLPICNKNQTKVSIFVQFYKEIAKIKG